MKNVDSGKICFFSYMGRKRMVAVVKENDENFTGWDYTRRAYRTFKKSKIRRFTNQDLVKIL